ncbi:DUF402 domain-containing protein [Microbacterium sp. GXS0129]|uniref:DUF402 domain-containing protein n=1 Tax=Microbacterium sp. GXS0129 TaxID=3377836 RepID=UPI00383B644F
MRLPIGTVDVSASGGRMQLVGRRGEGWQQIAESPITLAEALIRLRRDRDLDAHADPLAHDSVASGEENAPRFRPGESILWRYDRYIEAVRVIRDDERALVVWIPSGSARLEAAPADGRRVRDVPVDERFSVPWRMQESTWRGPGVVRVAPTGMPWSLWFFRGADGSADGVYVNLELPHRRAVDDDGTGAVFTRDLVLDLWIDAEHVGTEDVWLKDADELVEAVQQGRFTPEQADAVRALADLAHERFIADGAWPLDEGWGMWVPDVEMDVPARLPESASIAAARARSGRTSGEG